MLYKTTESGHKHKNIQPQIEWTWIRYKVRTIYQYTEAGNTNDLMIISSDGGINHVYILTNHSVTSKYTNTNIQNKSNIHHIYIYY